VKKLRSEVSMAKYAKLGEVNLHELMGRARMSPADLMTAMGHSGYYSGEWYDQPPTYVVANLEAQAGVYTLVRFLEGGEGVEGFRFTDALAELGMSKAAIGRRLGVGRTTVTRWGDDPPEYAARLVQTLLLLKRCSDDR